MRSRRIGSTSGARSLRPFTGLVSCGECGKPLYCQKSKNAKGEYRYLACSTRHRLEPDECTCKTTIHDDILVEKVKQALSFVFDDTDDIIAQTIEIVREQTDQARSETQCLRSEIKQINADTTSRVALLVDPAISDGAKAEISRDLERLGAKRQELEQALELRTDQHQDDMDELATNVEQAMNEALERFDEVATPTELNRRIDDFIGPIEVCKDGSIRQSDKSKTAPVYAVAVPMSHIVGAGYDSPNLIWLAVLQYRRVG